MRRQGTRGAPPSSERRSAALPPTTLAGEGPAATRHRPKDPAHLPRRPHWRVAVPKMTAAQPPSSPLPQPPLLPPHWRRSPNQTMSRDRRCVATAASPATHAQTTLDAKGAAVVGQRGIPVCVTRRSPPVTHLLVLDCSTRQTGLRGVRPTRERRHLFPPSTRAFIGGRESLALRTVHCLRTVVSRGGARHARAPVYAQSTGAGSDLPGCLGGGSCSRGLPLPAHQSQRERRGHCERVGAHGRLALHEVVSYFGSSRATHPRPPPPPRRERGSTTEGGRGVGSGGQRRVARRRAGASPCAPPAGVYTSPALLAVWSGWCAHPSGMPAPSARTTLLLDSLRPGGGGGGCVAPTSQRRGTVGRGGARQPSAAAARGARCCIAQTPSWRGGGVANAAGTEK